MVCARVRFFGVLERLKVLIDPLKWYTGTTEISRISMALEALVHFSTSDADDARSDEWLQPGFYA